ncbi:MAG: NAD-dependent epimerase/dehydratase family protein [Proteobacteria bacterium]|nr:MAG: NAD-dependent epimerase/dehydratase family protein [Pseudomonadota bacterium]
MKKLAFVTGIAGFIGAAIASRLLLEGWEVHGIDNLSTGDIEKVPRGAEFRRLSAESVEAAQLLKDLSPTIVFHVGGQSSGEVGELNPNYDIQSNVVSTLNMLTASSRSSNLRRYRRCLPKWHWRHVSSRVICQRLHQRLSRSGWSRDPVSFSAA